MCQTSRINSRNRETFGNWFEVGQNRGNRRRKRECPNKNGSGEKRKNFSQVWEHGLRLHKRTEVFIDRGC